ncbi:MAG: hypothetical protein CBC27_00885 [Opitutia bacterium TMED67]|nr:MAG: hypothetical protein CBC27_03480 [Opitutae bacterium TMED67]OUU77319.1 MAG: hypothetical protein CBC27_00885 [Opitutae bacterium TMED67]
MEFRKTIMSKENKIEEVIIHTKLLDKDFSLEEIIELLPSAFKYAQIDDILEISLVDALEENSPSPYKIKE